MRQAYFLSEKAMRWEGRWVQNTEPSAPYGKNVFLTNTREWRMVLDQQEFPEMAGYAKCVLMTKCIYEQKFIWVNKLMTTFSKLCVLTLFFCFRKSNQF